MSVTNPFRYVSGVYDTTTGLTKFGARYYDPALGRFTQQDPTRQESNSYAYVRCNPINATDPSGELSRSCIIALVLAGVAIAGFEASLFVGGAASVASAGIASPGAALVVGIAFVGAAGSLIAVADACGDGGA